MAVVQTAEASVSEALFRMSGMYGSAWRDGELLSEIVQVSATVEQAQIDVALVGQTKMGHKVGRETRSGTLDLQKIDTRWEMDVWNFISKPLSERRKARDQGQRGIRQFQLLIEMDDPDALGIEKWQLDGCQIYRMNLGFNIADDLIVQQIPFTWESETPIYAFTRAVGAGGIAIPKWYGGYGPPPAV